MSTLETGELDSPGTLEAPAAEPAPPPPTTEEPPAPVVEPEAEPTPEVQAEAEAMPLVARPLEPPRGDTLYVPLAVSVGDGFKFGCGFFLAMSLVMLSGFVLLAALFALTSVTGLALPFGR